MSKIQFTGIIDVPEDSTLAKELPGVKIESQKPATAKVFQMTFVWTEAEDGSRVMSGGVRVEYEDGTQDRKMGLQKILPTTVVAQIENLRSQIEAKLNA